MKARADMEFGSRVFKALGYPTRLLFAQELGIGEDLIQEAVELAKDIRACGDKHMDEFAQRRIETRSNDTAGDER